MHIRLLHAGFGAEILDFDLFGEVESEEIDELRSAFDEYQLLLFRCGQKIEPGQQVEVSRWFRPRMDDSGEALSSVLHNEKEEGRVRLPFHSDLSYTDSPIEVISLHAIEVPVCGAKTSFVSGIHAWSTLPSDRQEILRDMTLRHYFKSELFEEWPEFIADHPIRLLHPRTGRPILYVSEYHADRIYELEAEKSQHMIAALLAHLYGPEQIYVHEWQLYDLIIWDNLALQHARTEEAKLQEGPRALRRVGINEVSYSEILERARQQALQRNH